MKRSWKYIAAATALTVVACTGPDGQAPSPEQTAVGFCSTYARVLNKLALFRLNGQLSEGTISVVDQSVQVVGPYCLAETPAPPTTSLVDALDQLLLILAAQEG